MKSTIQKIATILLCIYSTTAEAPSKGYLPPEEGYNYDAPSVPFPSPAPSYKPPPTYRPRPIIPQQPPSYPTAYPSPAPTYTPRPYVPPKPSGGYGPGPYDQSGSAISPVGQNQGEGLGGGEFDHLRIPHVPGMPFDFNYAVKDDYYGTDFGHQATSNGDQVRGEYRVLLPDGRLQIVKYVADWKDGYTAEVTYQGEAKYPTGIPGSGGSNIGAGYRPQPGAGGYPGPQPGAGGYPGPQLPTGPSKPINYPRPGFGGSSYNPVQQPGPAIPSYPSVSSPRPTYGQQPVSGYGGSQQGASGGYGQPTGAGYGSSQPSGYGGAQPSGGYPSSPAPSYSTGAAASDYGSYKK